MPTRSIYLAKHRLASRERHHFTLFIPNAADDRSNLSQTFDVASCKGTVIHVIGEPLFNGYRLEFKRNYECLNSKGLKALVYLGPVDDTNLFVSNDRTYALESAPRSALEREAQRVPPPPSGQDVRAPIDGVSV